MVNGGTLFTVDAQGRTDLATAAAVERVGQVLP